MQPWHAFRTRLPLRAHAWLAPVDTLLRAATSARGPASCARAVEGALPTAQPAAWRQHGQRAPRDGWQEEEARMRLRLMVSAC